MSRSYQGIDLSVYRDAGERANMARIHNYLQDLSRAMSSNVAATSSSVGAAPSDGAYLMIGNNASLSAERAIVTTSPLTATDGGANSSWTLGLTPSALDHGTLGGLGDAADHTWALLVDGSRPLTAPWDAGNFAVTLGSVVGKSGDLAITAAATGATVITGNIASGASNYAVQIKDTVARTTGGMLAVYDSVGTVRARFNSSNPGFGAFELLSSASGLDEYNYILRFNYGVTKNIAPVFGNSMFLQNSGSGGAIGLNATITTQGAAGGAFARAGGLEIMTAYTAASTFGANAANRFWGATFTNTFAANSQTIPTAWGVMIGNAGTPTGVTRWGGLLVGAKPSVVTAAVGVYSVENIAVPAATKMIFDSTATLTHSATSGASTFSAYTEGDTYLVYNSGSTQLDLYVDAAQAFHFDAGGAAGTSKCYGALTVDGTLAATAAATVGTTLQVTGIATFLTHSRWGDNDQIQLGDAQDALIYYDGTNVIFNSNDVGSGGVLFGDSASGPNFHIGRNGAGAFVLCSGNAKATTGAHFAFRDVGGISATLLTVSTSGAGGQNTDIDQGAAGPLQIGTAVTTTLVLGRSGQQTTMAGDVVATGTNGIDVTNDLRARQVIADGDNAGVASTTSLTNTTSAADTNVPTMVNTPTGVAAAQVGWIKIYVGTTASYVPYWQ